MILLILIMHLTHHLDWTTLPSNQIIGPKGFVVGPLHIFIH